MWFIGVEVEQETSAPPPKKNPGSAPVFQRINGFFSSQLSCQLFSPLPHGFNCRLDSHPLSILVATLVTSLYVFFFLS